MGVVVAVAVAIGYFAGNGLGPWGGIGITEAAMAKLWASETAERAAYKAMETAERARRADLEAQGIIRRRGPRLKIKVPMPQAEVEETHAIDVFDIWCWLLDEIRQALEPITPAYRIVSVMETKATVETAIELLADSRQAFREGNAETAITLMSAAKRLDARMNNV